MPSWIYCALTCQLYAPENPLTRYCPRSNSSRLPLLSGSPPSDSLHPPSFWLRRLPQLSLKNQHITSTQSLSVSSAHYRCRTDPSGLLECPGHWFSCQASRYQGESAPTYCFLRILFPRFDSTIHLYAYIELKIFTIKTIKVVTKGLIDFWWRYGIVKLF